MKFKTLLIIFIIISIFPFYIYGEKTCNYWLNMSRSERASYLVGYVEGVDSGVDAADVYDGLMYENLFNSDNKLKRAILKKTSQYYKSKENRFVDWQHMILLAYLELQGESKDIIEMRLRMTREILKPHLKNKKIKMRDYWFQSSLAERLAYLNGLIKGIKLGLHLDKERELEIINLFKDIFNMKEKINALTPIVTEIVNDESYRKIDFKYIFPLAHIKYTTGESAFHNFIKSIKDKKEN